MNPNTLTGLRLPTATTQGHPLAMGPDKWAEGSTTQADLEFKEWISFSPCQGLSGYAQPQEASAASSPEAQLDHWSDEVLGDTCSNFEIPDSPKAPFLILNREREIVTAIRMSRIVYGHEYSPSPNFSVSSGSTAVGPANHGPALNVTPPGPMAPVWTNPGPMALGLTNPGAVALGLTNPGMIAPGLTNPLHQRSMVYGDDELRELVKKHLPYPFNTVLGSWSGDLWRGLLENILMHLHVNIEGISQVNPVEWDALFAPLCGPNGLCEVRRKRTKGVQTIECRTCGTTFSNNHAEKYACHLLHHYDIKAFLCEECKPSKAFGTIQAYKSHQRNKH